MNKYYVLFVKDRYQEVRADCLEDVLVWCVARYGKLHTVTDDRNAKRMAGRKFAGLSEIPAGYAESKR